MNIAPRIDTVKAGDAKSVLAVLAITPARNEGNYIEVLIDAMERQTVKPSMWMVVDDGSNDNTSDRIRKLAESHDWVQLRQRTDRGYYYRGKGVAETFAYGVEEATKIMPNWNLLAKVDADTDLPESYFEQVARKFADNPRLGIASGINVGEAGILTHPRGNNRVYRRECWNSIGALPAISGWDTWDETLARSKGWQTLAFADIRARHLRPEAATFRYSYHQGKISRFLGYSWLLAFGRAMKICYQRNPPCGVGYLIGYLRETKRIEDEEFLGLIRREQYSRLKGYLKFWRFLRAA